MATSLTTSMNVTFKTTFTNAQDLSTPEDVQTFNLSDTLASGTGLDQADLVWHDRRTLNNAAEDLDVSGGLTDVYGNAITMVKVKGLVVHNRNTTAGEYIDMGGDGNGLLIFLSATDIIRIHPNGLVFLWNPSLAGYAVTAATGDILQMDTTGSGASVSYDIKIIGTSA